jgi:hypothetical protein
MSPVVHASLSEQDDVLFACWQPVCVSQVSSVQGLPSSQLVPVPGWQTPAEQASPVVQALPSEQAVPLAAGGPDWHRPDDGLQLSGPLQTLPSSVQVTDVPPTQAPPWQESPEVQALPSLHAVPSLGGAEETQRPVAGLQVSEPLQTLPSSGHVTGEPPTQLPPWQESPEVQALPSEHDVPLASVFVWQAPAPLQVSGLSHAVSLELPQAVPIGAGPPLTQDPL